MRLKIIGGLETMRDSDLPTVVIISLSIIFKRTVALLMVQATDAVQYSCAAVHSGGSGMRDISPLVLLRFYLYCAYIM